MGAALGFAVAACVRPPPPPPAPAPEPGRLDGPTGAWPCDRSPAVSDADDAAGSVDVRAAMHEYAIGYVAGMFEASGRRLPEDGIVEARIDALRGEACRSGPARTVRAASRAAGTALLAETATAPQGGPPPFGATARLTCERYEAVSHDAGGRRTRAALDGIHDWVDGFASALLDAAGAGTPPTAQTRAALLGRVAERCATDAGLTIEDAARDASAALRGAGGAAR